MTTLTKVANPLPAAIFPGTQPTKSCYIWVGPGAVSRGGADGPYPDPDTIKPAQRVNTSRSEGSVLKAAKSIEKAATSMFVLSTTRPTVNNHSGDRAQSRPESQPRAPQFPKLSRQATVGRNSRFSNMTEDDREILGGVEYRALKLLFKFVIGSVTC
ncbi:uncharacterized protein ColSpa_11996 [Colletotrichum spaethianum]|uniref:Uncharacterized protein n=1 Tax=Colletotrichum spaethianum TaxID=700344 RepID=A0AA37PGD1_9PEZI|nr:uncharacterized protein ColSpa_11996 [Colletotrichum spaethianum]GKT51815.1 hypothetical protein ColSpa_11996 [Colletotrichum spaethianum]